MTRFKYLNGVRVELTTDEENAVIAKETAWNDGAFDRAITNLRFERNKLLKETDWLANSDVTMSDDWKTYRQSLRDLPSGLDTVEKVNNVTWPTKPS